jgi:hypothetical protein
MAFGSLPPVPGGLSLGEQLELNAINIEILKEKEQHETGIVSGHGSSAATPVPA